MVFRKQNQRNIVSVFTCIAAACIQISSAEKVCIIGAGIAGTSLAYFIQNSSDGEVASKTHDVHIFEASDTVGGRLALVNLSGDLFEKGGSVIHKKNLHMLRFAKELGLEHVPPGPDKNFGIWNGSSIILSTSRASSDSWWSTYSTTISNLLVMVWRYGLSPLYTRSSTSDFLNRFLGFYAEDLPAFESLEKMLGHVRLLDLTKLDLEDLLSRQGVSPLFIDELITAGTRVNYGQDKHITALAGSVSIAGMDGQLWAVKGGNRQVPEGLARLANASVHLNARVASVSSLTREGGSTGYELLVEGAVSPVVCDAVAVATPLENAHGLRIEPPPKHMVTRPWQRTFATFIRGVVNPAYFGIADDMAMPSMIFTLEDSKIPFSSLSILRQYPEDGTSAYKLFSREAPTDKLLDALFRSRNETVRIDWAAYPHYVLPEDFMRFRLDDDHLYYINAFESAASAMECSAVAAQNVAKLMLESLAKAKARGRSGLSGGEGLELGKEREQQAKSEL